MRIQIIKTFTDPGGNEHVAGSVENVHNSVAAQYFEWKVAKHHEYRDYHERLAETMPASVAPLIQWAVNETQGARSAVIVKMVNAADQTVYSEPPADCPPGVVARFRHICRLDVEYGAGKAETARLELEREANKEKDAAGLGRLLTRG